MHAVNMLSILNRVLATTFGLLYNKCRDHTANKLQEGGVTDQKCRQLIVRELDDIKKKLDGLSRKNLLSSISCLREGLRQLNIAINKRAEREGEASSTLENVGNFQVDGACPFELSKGIRELKIVYEMCPDAIDLFKEARMEAKRAFNNTYLPIEDRILATRLQVISRILEKLENPDDAANICKFYLEELHDTKAVQEMFSVYLDGGIKSYFYTTSRLEKIMSVIMINFVLFDFTYQFTKLSSNLFNWPRIKLDHDRSCQPMMANSEMFANKMHCEVTREYRIYSFSVNSKREIVTWSTSDRESLVVIDTTTGESRSFCTLTGATDRMFWYGSIAIDADDNVYIIVELVSSDGGRNYKLFIFNTNGISIKESSLTFLDGKFLGFIRVVLSGPSGRDPNIIIHESGGETWLCDQDGELQWNFHLECNGQSPHLGLSDRNEIILAPDSGRLVYMYTVTEEGKTERTIQVPEGHKVRAVAFNHITREVVVGTLLDSSYFLSSYSETGEHFSIQNTFQLPFVERKEWTKIISHPSGPVAFAHEKGVIFIQ